MAKRGLIHRKVNSALRAGLKTSWSLGCGNYLLSEYPKSGGSWIATMISSALEIPFPRNRLPVIGRQMLHGHYLAQKNNQNTFVVIRDGRDIMVSYYYHCLFENEHFNGGLVERTKSKLQFSDLNDIEHNLPKFIEFLFEDKMFPKFTWSDFVNSWIETDVCFIRYEDVLTDASAELRKALNSVVENEFTESALESIVESNSFANIAKRPVGEEESGSFLRKGIAGDWKNKFSIEARSVFDHYAGNELVKLRYEKDSSWLSGSYCL